MSSPNDIYDHFVMLQNRILARLTVTDPAVDRVAENWPVPMSANEGARISFMTERVGNLESMLQKSLNQLGGIACIILTPTARMLEPGEESLELEAPVLIQIQENVLINQGAKGTKISALTMVAFIMRRLQGFSHGLYGGTPEMSRMHLDPKPFVLIKDENPVIYNVAAIAPLDLEARLPDEFDALLFDDGSVVQYA
jgi:hypothetical protein